MTEGNPEAFGLIWERLRCDWSEPGRVRAVVKDSNVFHPGSTWEIRATPNGAPPVEVRAPGPPAAARGRHELVAAAPVARARR